MRPPFNFEKKFLTKLIYWLLYCLMVNKTILIMKWLRRHTCIYVMHKEHNCSLFKIKLIYYLKETRVRLKNKSDGEIIIKFFCFCCILWVLKRWNFSGIGNVNSVLLNWFYFWQSSFSENFSTSRKSKLLVQKKNIYSVE